jgi:hypothetical protein
VVTKQLDGLSQHSEDEVGIDSLNRHPTEGHGTDQTPRDAGGGAPAGSVGRRSPGDQPEEEEAVPCFTPEVTAAVYEVLSRRHVICWKYY